MIELMRELAMQNNDGERPDDPRTGDRKTQRLALDEYEHPRYSGGERYARRGEHGIAAPYLRASAEADLDRLRVHELMTPSVASVEPATPVQEAARTIAERDCGALPVVGVLAQSDLARHAGSHAQPEERWALAEVLRAISEPAAPGR
jgi:hypothetical protein